MPHLSLLTSHLSPRPAALPHNSELSLWLSVDPLSDKYPNLSPYVYCGNNPVRLVDVDGRKDRPFDAKKDKPITPIPYTETFVFVYGRNHEILGLADNWRSAYNCHSYAWHNSNGDQTPAEGDRWWIKDGDYVPRWDNNPADDIIEQNAKQLGKDEANITGDIVIYYSDNDGNGQYDHGENIFHSAVVTKVDDKGYTIEVTGKMGQGPISTNHPDAPGYYDTADSGNKPSRAYFRIPKSTE